MDESKVKIKTQIMTDEVEVIEVERLRVNDVDIQLHRTRFCEPYIIVLDKDNNIVGAVDVGPFMRNYDTIRGNFKSTYKINSALWAERDKDDERKWLKGMMEKCLLSMYENGVPFEQYISDVISGDRFAHEVMGYRRMGPANLAGFIGLLFSSLRARGSDPTVSQGLIDELTEKNNKLHRKIKAMQSKLWEALKEVK